MTITHQGHSCVRVEKDKTVILLDPGVYAFEVNGKKPEEFTGIQAVCYTHEHSDHFSMEILQVLIQANPGLRIIVNSSIHAILTNAGISSEVIAPGTEVIVGELKIQGWDCPHESLPQGAPEAVGFLVDGRVLHPGDSITPSPVAQNLEVLLAPATAPWMNAMEAVEFVERMRPKIVMPIHTAVLRHPELVDRMFTNILRERGFRVEPQRITL